MLFETCTVDNRSLEREWKPFINCQVQKQSLQTFKKVEFKIKWRCNIVVIDIISGVIIIKYH